MIRSFQKIHQRADRHIKFHYPKTKTLEFTDVYFGTQVADPFRWLEDDTTPEVEAWVDAQNEVTFRYLESIPYRNQIKQDLKTLWDYEKYSTIFKEGKYYFFFKNDGLQNQPVLYIQKNLDETPEIFLDPNTYSDDGTVALTNWGFSKDGRYMGYGISRSGSDWQEISVIDVESRTRLNDKVKWAKFTAISWQKDGFYYSRYTPPEKGKTYSQSNTNHSVYYHKLGTPQSEDQLIYKDNTSSHRILHATVTEDERFLIIESIKGSSGNSLYMKDLHQPNSDFITVVGDLEHEHTVIDNIEDKLLILTNLDAPNRRLVMADIAHPTPEYWQDLVPENQDVLQYASPAGGKLFLSYMHNAYTRIYQCDMGGQIEHEVKLPAIGTVPIFKGKKEENEIFYIFTSFTFPTAMYRYDIPAGISTVVHKPSIQFAPEDFETKQVFYPSKDETMISMFIVHKKGLQFDENNPTYLYGYGGFNLSVTPAFKTALMYFLQQGGVYAVPNIRGGGEYGEQWHKAGMLEQKQNSFDDFIAAAEYLIRENYTSPQKLAIAGSSNGGLLVGAAMTQRPELFQVVLPSVGVLDMLRYHHFTIGWAWTTEYGCADCSQKEFEYLYQYSPLHNLKAGTHYPAALVTTSDHDDRVVPAHSFKFIAELQRKQAGPNPVMIRIEKKAGHGTRKPTSKTIDEWADIWAFVFHNLGMYPRSSF